MKPVFCACCADVNKNTTPTQKLLSSEQGHSHRELTSTLARHAMDEEPFPGFSWGVWRMDATAKERFPPSFQGDLCPASPLPQRGCGAAVCLGVVIFTPPDLLHLLNSGTFQTTFFFFFLENHLTTKGKKRDLKEFRTNLHSIRCPSKKINICGHVWKMHDGPLMWLPSLKAEFWCLGPSAACASSWWGLSQGKYLRLGRHTVLSRCFLDDMFALSELLEHQGSTKTFWDKILSRIHAGSSNYFPGRLRKWEIFSPVRQVYLVDISGY